MLAKKRRHFLGASRAQVDSLPVGKRPKNGLLDLRKGLGLYVNLRPVKVIELCAVSLR